MSKTKLTDKQKAFCHYYIIDWNATKAAILAGYSEKTARQLASDTLSKAYIQDYIEEIQQDIAKEAGISMLSQALELKKIAMSNISLLHNDWITRKEFEDLPEDIKASIQEISTSVKRVKMTDEKGEVKMADVEYVKIKLHDKIRAIQEINKMFGYAVESIDIKSGGEKIQSTPIVVVNEKTKDNLDKLVNEDD
jgi:phage terminase small subunit